MERPVTPIEVKFRTGDRHQLQTVHAETLQIPKAVDDAVKAIVELLDLQFINDQVVQFGSSIRRVSPYE